MTKMYFDLSLYLTSVISYWHCTWLLVARPTLFSKRIWFMQLYNLLVICVNLPSQTRVIPTQCTLSERQLTFAGSCYLPTWSTHHVPQLTFTCLCSWQTVAGFTSVRVTQSCSVLVASQAVCATCCTNNGNTNFTFWLYYNLFKLCNTLDRNGHHVDAREEPGHLPGYLKN